MRLWHAQLINKLPRPQLLGQHRECCALRGNGWGKPHSTVNYVFNHLPYKLFLYHKSVMNEMKQRGYNVTEAWLDPFYRGRQCEPWSEEEFGYVTEGPPHYPEHDEAYLKECLENLRGKGIMIKV